MRYIGFPQGRTRINHIQQRAIPLPTLNGDVKPPARDLFDHRDTTAGLMRIGGQAAQFYVTAELISKTADQIVLKKLDSRVGNELV